jgi:lipopolysaccharide/colanic/teichoic acid biosynthesis glycosyltransferase
LSARSLVSEVSESVETPHSAITQDGNASAHADAAWSHSQHRLSLVSDAFGDDLSPWVLSGSKRCFDCACVLLALPLLIPVFLLVALAIRLTSHGPVLFLQKRMGRHGHAFTIFKFRTMAHRPEDQRSSVTTVGNQTFTPVGPFLRRWKLDELPQLLNVLRGDMSLVGPRPKLPAHQKTRLNCRPGITGAATIAFAREEQFLARLPKHDLDAYYHSVVLPAKLRLDAEYMSRATFFSDLELILDTLRRRWDTSVMSRVLGLDSEPLSPAVRTMHARTEPARLKVLKHDESFAQAD